MSDVVQRLRQAHDEDGGWLFKSLFQEAADEIEKLTMERNNFEGELQLTEEALWQTTRDAERYRVVRSHAADVSPEEMDLGADVIIAQRKAQP